MPKNTYRICLLFIFFISIKMTQYIYHYNPEHADPSHVFVFATEANGLLKNGYGPAARKYHGAPLKKPMGFSQTEKGKEIVSDINRRAEGLKKGMSDMVDRGKHYAEDLVKKFNGAPKETTV